MTSETEDEGNPMGNLRCLDTPDWKDAKGYTCSSWSDSEDCSKIGKRIMLRGYTLDELVEVLDNCKASCKLCRTWADVGSKIVKGCEDTEDFVDEKGRECSDWRKFPFNGRCEQRAPFLGYTTGGKKQLLENCRESCKVCFNPKTGSKKDNDDDSEGAGCADTEDFTDALGKPCSSWEGNRFKPIDCNRAYAGYTVFQQQEVVANCPQSCGLCD
jgi:hypothetical protein